MTKENQDFSLWAGDYKTVRFFCTGLAAPGDVKAAEWKMSQVEDGSTVIAKTKAAGGITITQAVGGVYATVILEAADTDGHPGLYYHELELTDQSDHPETVAVGQVRVRSSLT